MKLPLAVPTVSFVVLQCLNELTPEDVLRLRNHPAIRRVVLRPAVYVVRFREKHNGGIGVPGGRLKFQSANPMDQFVQEGGEELGLDFEAWQAIPFTTRCRAGRDVRTKISPTKYTHGAELPSELAGLPAELFEAHHCIDMVYLVMGVTADPTTLVPKDTVEVEKIELLDLTQPLPPLPISDDAELLTAVHCWAIGTVLNGPVFLHG